jgi:hypothetical protein
MTRRHNFQNLAWFHDLHQRGLLDLEPPYQRRSVWSQSFKDYFVDTVLLNYPAPALFLYEEVDESGRSAYHVVDGKQRLTTLFDFVGDAFSVSDESELSACRGTYFKSLDPGIKKAVWSYQFLVEYIPTDDEAIINAIFDRINRNVAKLSAQELRHARYGGRFITVVEELAQWLVAELPSDFPRIAPQSRRQMKDVELVALLALLIEDGPAGYSQADLDEAFARRDDDWEQETLVSAKLKGAVEYLKRIVPHYADIAKSRLRNQADFYSLIGAIVNLDGGGKLPAEKDAASRLMKFMQRLEDDSELAQDSSLQEYFESARSASNDKGPREKRIAYVTKVLLGTAAT